ncbi:MAG: hypothetical protein LBR10_09905 [Prevotellaceae bacterium]|nr:hypothetical protein [Prevotellaceae bacterium]
MIILTNKEFDFLNAKCFFDYKPPEIVSFVSINETQVMVDHPAIYECLENYADKPHTFDISTLEHQLMIAMCQRNSFITPSKEDFIKLINP